MCDLVSELFEKSFSRLLFHEKIELIKAERSTPTLPNLSQQKSKNNIRHFTVVKYEKFDWLTGS
jgi:hypothetical protein